MGTAKLLDSHELKQLTTERNITLLDAHFSPQSDAVEEFVSEHIPGAQYFDISKASRKTDTQLRSLLHSSEFEDFAKSLGISNSRPIVCYDRSNGGIFGAARAWFLLTTYGHKDVSILNGGFVKWKELEMPITSEVTRPKSGKFSAKFDHSLLVEVEEFASGVSAGTFQVLDCRPPAAYHGTDPSQKIHGTEGSRVKNALNTPTPEFVRNGLVIDNKEIKNVLTKKGVDMTKPTIAICRSGMQSSTCTFIANRIGMDIKNLNGAYFELAKKHPNLINEV